jgi:hypothetical protein
MSMVAGMLLVCHGSCCCSGTWLLLFSTSPIQCSTVAALLRFVTPLGARMPSRRFPLASVEGLAQAATAARVGAGARELARGSFTLSHCRRERERERAGAPPLGTAADAASMGSGELRPWRRRRRDCGRGGAPPPATAATSERAREVT